MKKISSLFLLAFFLLASFAYAEIESVVKPKAKIILSKTNRALGVAHMTVKRTKKYTGNLSKAVKHARYAKKLYNAGDYDNAVYHSLYARKLAIAIMSENGAKTGSDFIYSPDENTLLDSSPKEDDLNAAANKDTPADITDESLMNGGMDIEVQ